MIQYTVLRRVPDSMMADDVRADFQASHDIIEQMAQHSGVARRALPMLEQLYERINHGASGAETTATAPATNKESTELLDSLFSSCVRDAKSTCSRVRSSNNLFGTDPAAMAMNPAYAPAMDNFFGFEYPATAGPDALADPLIQTLYVSDRYLS